MPLHFATEPKNGTALVREGMNKLSRRTSPLSARAVDFSAIQVNQPHAVYDLRADAVASGGGLAFARPSSIRYLVDSASAHLAAAEVLLDVNGSATLLANLNYGPFVEATAQALLKLATLAAVSQGSYEVRLLRFSAIGLMALWLKSDSGAADIVYPLAPAPAGLQAEYSYSVDDFIKAILPLAQKRAANKGERAVP